MLIVLNSSPRFISALTAQQYVTIASVSFISVFIGDYLCHRERYPYPVVKGLCGKNNTIFEPFEAQCIFQILVNVKHFTVKYHQIQFIPRSILNYEMIDYFKAFTLVGNSS